jgi:hypothetical protein
MISAKILVDSEREDEAPEAVLAMRKTLAEYASNARNRLHSLRRSAMVGVSFGIHDSSEEKTAKRNLSR